MSSSRSFLCSATFAGLALFAACDSTTTEADDAGGNPPIKSDGGGASGGKRDSGSATPPKKDSGTQPAPDAATEDEPQDASADAEEPVVGDGGPTLVAPAPGTDCTVVGEKFSRGCGACGSQVALCNTSRKVSGYGSCRDAEGDCEPGTTLVDAVCGACGTTTRVCNAECVFVDQVCTGETGACVAGRTEQRQDNCPTGRTKMFECTDACAWQLQTGATCGGTAAFPFADIGATVSTTIDIPVLASEMKKMQRNYLGSCSSLSIQNVWGRHIELLNPTNTIAKVDVWSTVPSSPYRDLVMVAYDEPPFAVGDLVGACTAVTDICSTAPYSAVSDVCLAGTRAVTIPANGRRWVYVGNFSSTASAIDLTVHVKTTSLQ